MTTWHFMLCFLEYAVVVDKYCLVDKKNEQKNNRHLFVRLKKNRPPKK